MMRAKTVSVEGEAAVDKFKSCVRATMRKCKGSSGNSSRGSCTALAHAQREKRRNQTNGYSKTQATETSRCCALLRSCYCCCCQRCAKITPRQARTHIQVHICISVYGYRFFFIPDRRHRICSDVALLLLRINYGNFWNSERRRMWTLHIMHVCLCVCVCARERCVRGCRQAAGNTASESRVSASQTIKTTRRVVSTAADDAASAARSATQHWHWFSHCSYTSFACSFFALSSLLLFLLLPRLSLVTCRTGCAGISHTHTHTTHICTNTKRYWERERERRGH